MADKDSDATPDTDTPPFWRTMSGLYGEMYAVHLDNPGKGILNALRGNYHSDAGQPGCGVEQWIVDHPPNP